MGDAKDDGLGLPFRKPARPQKSRWARLPLLLAVAACGVGSAVVLVPQLDRSRSAPAGSDTAAPSTPIEEPAPRVAALGRIEPRGGVVALSAPSGMVDTRVSAILVGPGDRVGADALVATLAGRAKAEASHARASAEVRLRRAELDRTRRLLEANRAEAEAGLAVARARLEQAESALARASMLEGSAAVSTARVEELRSDAVAERAEVARAEAQVSRYAGPSGAHPDVAAASEAVAAAEAAARLAAAEVEETLIRAPFAGTVVAVPGRLGERAGEEGVVRLAADGPMTIVLEVHQGRIGAVSLDDRVVLRSEAYSGELDGSVSEIAAEVRRQEEIGADPSARTDARVFEVRVLLDERSSEIARRLINVQVVAEIETGA